MAEASPPDFKHSCGIFLDYQQTHLSLPAIMHIVEQQSTLAGTASSSIAVLSVALVSPTQPCKTIFRRMYKTP